MDKYNSQTQTKNEFAEKQRKDPDIITAFDLNKSSIYKLKCLRKYFYLNFKKKSSLLRKKIILKYYRNIFISTLHSMPK